MKSFTFGSTVAIASISERGYGFSPFLLLFPWGNNCWPPQRTECGKYHSFVRWGDQQLFPHGKSTKNRNILSFIINTVNYTNVQRGKQNFNFSFSTWAVWTETGIGPRREADPKRSSWDDKNVKLQNFIQLFDNLLWESAPGPSLRLSI